MIVAPFPPRPRSLVGRKQELATLATLLGSRRARVALVGSGGSGKTTLAQELAHSVASWFPGGVHWLRIGAWDERVLGEMLALRLGLRRRSLRDVASALRRGGERLIVFDNHEDDRATAAVLEAVGPRAPVSVVVTARRCLVAGITIVPVVPPLVLAERAPFPRVKGLTRALRSSPLALGLADALVKERVTSARTLAAWLEEQGLLRVRALEHEDDVPEVALLVERAWRALDTAPRRLLSVLAHVDGEHVDHESLARLARVGSRAEPAIARLRSLRLVQEPFRGRFALHATVKHALVKKTRFDRRRIFEHYVALLEREPRRLLLEESHLFAAMDYAHEIGELDSILRVDALVSALSQGG